MTPQEAQLIDGLFDRLAKLESAPRDPAAERLISDGLQRAPHAVYALVQTALVQDEALRRANDRIEELEAQTANAEPVEPRPASFLDNMREALTGRPAAHGSVPSVRPPAPDSQPQNLRSEGSQSQNFQPQGSQPQGSPPPPGYPGGPPLSSGGSFLGSAASTAAGVVGGSLLLDGIRSMFGRPGGSGAFAGESSSPWKNTADPGAANTGLARDLGADRISKQDDAKGNDQESDVESVSDTDDDYDADDSDDTGDDDFDAGDADDDSYDA
jgi:hypothetical protein